jgi:uncharacterized protein (UPF0248 family)
MIPIHDLLSRIRWDPAFGRGRWEIGYLDRVQATLVRVPLDEIRTEESDRFAFEVVDEEGIVRSIPYHRIRMVWRNAKVVWTREAVAPPRKVEKPRPVRKAPAREPRMRR